MTNPFEFTPAQNLFHGLRAPGPKWFGRRLWPGYDLAMLLDGGPKRVRAADVDGDE